MSDFGSQQWNPEAFLYFWFFSSRKQWIYILCGVYTCKSLQNEENILLKTLYPFQSQSYASL